MLALESAPSTTTAAGTASTTATWATASAGTAASTAARRASAAITAARRTIAPRRTALAYHGSAFDAVEVWLIAFFKIRAAFDHGRSAYRGGSRTLRPRRTVFVMVVMITMIVTVATLRRRSFAAHLGALFFEDGLA